MPPQADWHGRRDTLHRTAEPAVYISDRISLAPAAAAPWRCTTARGQERQAI